jgi:hypothetical protein
VSPNPFIDQVEIAISFGDELLLNVRDVQGRLVFQNVVSHGEILSTNEWPKGMYLFTFEDKMHNLHTIRVVK